MEEKKKSDSEFLLYNLMLNSWKKISHYARQKKLIFYLSCCPKKKLNGRFLSITWEVWNNAAEYLMIGEM